MRACFGLMVVMLMAAPALGDDSPTAVARELDRNFRKLKSISANVREEQISRGPAGVSTTTSAGKYEYVRADGKRMMRFERTETTNIASGALPPTTKSMLTIFDGEYTTVQTTIRSLVIAKRMKKVEDLPAFGGRAMLDRMLGENDVKRLDPEKDEDVVEEVEGRAVVSFEARPKRKGRVARSVYVFFEETGVLARMESFNDEGERLSLLTTTGVKTDTDIDPKRFVYTPPAGVNVIDETGGL